MPPFDIVYIKNLRLETVVGFHAWEQKVKQQVCINLQLHIDGAKAAKSDKVKDTVDYEQVVRYLKTMLNQGRYQLVETLAENIATVLQNEFGASWVRVEVGKPHVLAEADDVGVLIERGTPSK